MHRGGLGFPTVPPPCALPGSPTSRPYQRGPRLSFSPTAGRGGGRACAAPVRSPGTHTQQALPAAPPAPRSRPAPPASPHSGAQAPTLGKTRVQARPGPFYPPLPASARTRPALPRTPRPALTPLPVGGRTPASPGVRAPGVSGPDPGVRVEVGVGLAWPQARASPRWPPPAAVAARSRTPSAASSADMLGAPVPKAAAGPALPAAHVRALREGGRDGTGHGPRPRPRCRPGRPASFPAYWLPLPSLIPYPPPPGGYWPFALPVLPFLGAIGRSVRRSPAIPAQKLFPGWAIPLCFGDYWLPLLSVKAL